MLDLELKVSFPYVPSSDCDMASAMIGARTFSYADTPVAAHYRCGSLRWRC